MRHVLTLAFLFLSAPAFAQSVCQGGTATAPACSRNWATAPLTVQACPATLNTSAGVRLVLRETSGAPLLSVTAGTPGGTVTLPTSSAPLVTSGPAARMIEFSCEDATGAGGAATFASITFPVVGPPIAPTLL